MNVKHKWRGVTACVLGAALSFSLTAGATSLGDSNFEIDEDADFLSNDGGIDWDFAVGDGLVVATDLPTGSDDDSFKGGTKEDTVDPDTTFGSIPNNKSDLKHFGAYQETSNGRDYLHLFWTRVQDPSGTTLMDFEFNAGNFQHDPTSTGVQFPIREPGDVLVEYKLAQGGITPELFLYLWLEDAGDGVCEAGKYPCWGEQINLSAANIAIGSINTSIADGDGVLAPPPGIPNGTPVPIGDFDPYTFGEATIDLTALFPEGECVSFGSAHLKSRSSDSFTAQMKDFIAPIDVNISNCANINISKTDELGNTVNQAGAVFRLFYDDGDTPTVYDDADATNPDSRVQVLVAVPDTDPVEYELQDIEDCTTDGSGTCTWIDILAGEYCVVEVTPPDGHMLPEDPYYYSCGTVTADNDLDVSYVDPRIPGQIIVQKVDEDGTLLNGWSFALWTDDGGDPPAPETDLELSCVTGETEDGLCTIEGILPPEGEFFDTYCVVETNPLPDEYQDSDPQCGIVVELGDTGVDAIEVFFVNPRIPGAVNIQKEDEDGSLLNGWTFTLTKDVDGSPGDSTGLSCVTGAGEATDGVCTISGILPPEGETSATYCVVETNPLSDEYEDADGPQCGIVVGLGDTGENTPALNLTFVNPRIPGSVNIQKEDEDGTLLNGWIFTLWTDNGGAKGVDLGLSCETGAGEAADGVCTISGILPPEGETSATYCVVETNPLPDEYQGAADQCGIVVGLGDTGEDILALNRTFVNPRIPGSVNIQKEDEDGSLLNGWIFTLWTDNGGAKGVDLGLSCETGAGEAADGVCTISGILPPEGETSATYCVVETNPLPGQYEGAADQCGIVVGLGDTGEDIPALNRTFVNPRIPGSVNIQKEDDEGTLLNGWTFTLTNDVDGAPGASTGLSCVTGAGEAADGVCTISGILPPEGETTATYCVVETNPLPGQYQDAEGPQCGIVVGLGDTGENTPALNRTFVNPRLLGAIKITKTRKHAADGGGDQAHEGVTFTITGGNLAADGVDVVTDANGEACYEGLLVSSLEGIGDYTVTEDVPDGYVADAEEAKDVTVSLASECGDGNEATVSFSNTPLTNVTVSVDSQVVGGTASTIKCTDTDGNEYNGGTEADGDGSLTVYDLLPTDPTVTLICEITIDP
ncbi:MSCRAMM family protein [Marinobacterium sp. YM272]|uniref:MSCRAMM family protein n=1 Tax=Marinobacterium sp. YM272 TaxID=3421654 RepID=UPI003D7F87F1